MMFSMKKVALTLTTLACFGAGAVELPPEPGVPKNFTLPSKSSYTLENGLKVTLVPYGQTPKATIVLSNAAGDYYEGQKQGVAGVMYDVLTKGTTDLTSQQIAEQAASMGGQIYAYSSMNQGQVAIDVLSEYADDAAALIGQLVTTATFTQPEIDKATTNSIRSIEVAKSQAQGQATEAFYAAMYPNHPYHLIYPSIDDLASITQEDVVTYAKANLVAKRSHVYVAGVFDEKAVMKAIKQAFGAMPMGEPLPPLKVPEMVDEATLVMIPRDNAPQSTVRLGLRVLTENDAEYVPMSVMNTMLGGMFSSRITTNIRETKGYTYSPRSAVFTYKDAGVWFESADIQAESTGAALNEIIKEIKLIQNEAPSEQELNGVKNYMAGIFVLRNSSRGGVINQLINLEINQLPETRLTEYTSQVRAVTADDISKVATKYLSLDKMSLIVVGDEAQMTSQLQEVQGLPVLKNE